MTDLMYWNAGRRGVAMIVVVCLGMVAQVDAQDLKRSKYSQLHMGVQTTITAFSADTEVARSAIRKAFKRVAALEDVASNYRHDSEVSKLVRFPVGQKVRLSKELFELMVIAEDFYEATGGRFDVTAGPLTSLWRASHQSQTLPDPTEVEQARQRSGFHHLHLSREDTTLTLLRDSLEIDLGGLAKGYILDEALEALRKAGVQAALIEAGGDMVVFGSPPGQKAWRIEIEDADSESGLRVVDLVDGAIATSGDTSQFVEVDGVRYSHVVDLRSGLGLTTRRRATVTASKSRTADPLATALTLMPDEEAAALAQQLGAVILVSQVATSER